MNRLSSVALALGLSLLAGSCDEAAAPKGRPGTVIVAAYVDRDGSGTFTASDSALAGVQVNLVRDGQQVAQGTTGGDGRVEFEGMAPGSYRAELAAGAPAGAVLVTNPTPSAVVNFRGDSARVDFRFSFFPGTISGRLYRDDNTNGTYDAGSDTPGAGLRVFLRENNGGTAGDTLATVVTDADGVYTFGLVAPGSYFVEFENPGLLDFGAGGATRAVTVTGRQTTAMDVTFTGSLVIPIAEARTKADGASVAVEGNVTVPPNLFTSGTGGVNSEIWIQDATGGISVFSVPSTSTYALGDRLRVSGTIDIFNGQEQIANPGLTVTPIAGGSVVAPITITGTQAAARQEEGKLVRVTSITIDSSVNAGSAAFTVRGTTPDGATIRIRVAGANTGITRTVFFVGQKYTVTGVLTEFNTVAQIKPRTGSDVVQEAAPPPLGVRISEIHYDNTGTDVGEAIEVAGPAGTDLTGWLIYLYNGNGGVIYPPGNTGYPIGGVIPATCGTGGVFVINFPSNGLQNGGTPPEPDGLALVNASGTVVEFLSYEGVMTATNGPAIGLTSTNIGVAEAGTEPTGLSLQRQPDGTWTGPIASTFGACNDR